MVDARQILQPRFTYVKEVDSKNSLESVILRYSNMKEAIRVSQGITEYISDFEEYKKENEQLKFENVKDLYGIFGFVQRENREYLILIEESSLMGQILKCNIYRVDQVLIVPLQKDKNLDDQTHLGYIEKLVSDRSYYYSYNYNLTRSLQTNVNNVLNKDKSKEEEKEKVLQKKGNSDEFWAQYDTPFVYNRRLCTEWDSSVIENLWQFIVPVIYGYVFIHAIHFDQKKAEFILISRKDCRRLGRRFVSRGLDEEGNASNFVETEHILVHHEQDSYRVAAYVQTRGSIPLSWTQTPTLKYNPKLKINPDNKKNVSLAEKHFKETVDKYGDITLINLIDKKGSQKLIGDAFTKLIENLKNPKLFYEWFDFHHECRKMKYENLHKLIDKIKSKIDSYDYFMAKLDYAFDNKDKLGPTTCMVMCNQIGVCRTNCMDCLDRTNVVQSVISRLILHRQLYKMSVLSKPTGETFERFPQKFEEIFRHSWTHNANVCSILYSGTPALKTDFTLTGKRTIKGAIMDGVNSTKRYYINNFCDFYNQDVLDASLNKLNSSKMSKTGLPSFVLLILSTIIGKYLRRKNLLIIGLAIINASTKYLLGIHNLNPEDSEYTEIGTINKFLHIVIVVGITGAIVKKIML